MCDRNVRDVMPSVSAQVNKEVCQCLRQHGFSTLTQDREDLLKGQVEGVASPDHPVTKIVSEYTTKSCG